jgi:hypothetical protein
VNIHKRMGAVAVSAAFIGGTIAISPVAQASESSAAAPAAATTCLGSAKSYSTSYSSITGFYDWPASDGLATATSNCSDINVKPNATESVRTCFVSTATCNSFRTITGGTWGLAATAVLDGTQFWLDFKSGSTGHVAY